MVSQNFTDEQRVGLHKYAALSAFNLGDTPGAKEHFLKLLQLNPDYGPACQLMGGFYLHKVPGRDSLDRAEELLLRATHLPAYHPERQLPKPRIVIYGAPLRGIAPCGSCHGSLDNKAGSPWLEGQSEAYMKAQLQALASGQRSNDISQQMRNIARAMTPQEIGEAAAYYASQPPEVVKATD